MDGTLGENKRAQVFCNFKFGGYNNYNNFILDKSLKLINLIKFNLTPETMGINHIKLVRGSHNKYLHTYR